MTYSYDLWPMIYDLWLMTYDLWLRVWFMIYGLDYDLELWLKLWYDLEVCVTLVKFMICLIIWLTFVCIFFTGHRSSLLMMLLFQAIKDRKAGGEWDLASWCTRGDHIVEEDKAGLFIYFYQRMFSFKSFI